MAYSPSLAVVCNLLSITNMRNKRTVHSARAVLDLTQDELLHACAVALLSVEAGRYDGLDETKLNALKASSSVAMAAHIVRKEATEILASDPNHIAAIKQQEAANSFRSMNKPASEGTVAELAEKYGKSKSEIRRLKAANLLHTLAE